MQNKNCIMHNYKLYEIKPSILFFLMNEGELIHENKNYILPFYKLLDSRKKKMTWRTEQYTS